MSGSSRSPLQAISSGRHGLSRCLRQPDALAEYRDGYALAVTEYGQEENTVHVLEYDEHGNVSGRTAVKTGYGRPTALIPVPGNGFLMATETPEIIRTDAGGETR